MVHYVKAASTGCAKRTGAGPDHLLIGTVALFRMGKRVPVAEHHFRHPGAPRCGQGRHPALYQAAGAAPEGRPRGCPAGGAPLLGWWASPGPLDMPLPAYKLIKIAYARK